jgi:hypothetical protein
MQLCNRACKRGGRVAYIGHLQALASIPSYSAAVQVQAFRVCQTDFLLNNFLRFCTPLTCFCKYASRNKIKLNLANTKISEVFFQRVSNAFLLVFKIHFQNQQNSPKQ